MAFEQNFKIVDFVSTVTFGTYFHQKTSRFSGDVLQYNSLLLLLKNCSKFRFLKSDTRNLRVSEVSNSNIVAGKLRRRRNYGGIFNIDIHQIYHKTHRFTVWQKKNFEILLAEENNILSSRSIE